MPRFRVSVFAAFVTLALLVVSCSDSDDSEEGATTTAESTSMTTTTSSTASTTSASAKTSTTEGDAAGTLGKQPELIDRTISPSWVAELGEDFEDLPSLIRSVQGGGEAPKVSDTMARIIAAGLPDGQGLPYYYEAESAEGLVIAESVYARLDNGDSLSVGWRFLWADTPPCEVCTENQVL